jgi:hypothetical protein
MAAATDLRIPEPRFRLKLVPLAVAAALGYGVPVTGAYLAHFAIRIFHLPVEPGGNLGWLYLQHAGQLIVALCLIAAFKHSFLPGEYGLQRPPGKSYIGAAVLWGVVFGGLMTLVDYAPQIIAQTKPQLAFALTPANIWGWTFFEGVYVGPTEEIPFRALLVTYLTLTMPGRLRLGRFEMNWAGVIVAIIFALLHASSFDTRNWPEALGQQVYAFALGVLYAYWLEKSRSIIAPIIGHNVGDVIEYLILFAWLGVSIR